MSWQALKSVIFHSKSKGSKRVIMMLLAYHKNDKIGVCNPSISTLANEANIDRANIFRILSELQSDGEISVQSGKGSKKSNNYTILLPEVEKGDSRSDATIKSKRNSRKSASGMVANSQMNGRAGATQTLTNIKNNNNNGEVVVVLSKYDFQICFEYAKYCRELDPSIRSVTALAKHFSKTGKADLDIEIWLAEKAHSSREPQKPIALSPGAEEAVFAVAFMIFRREPLDAVFKKLGAVVNDGVKFGYEEFEAGLRAEVKKLAVRVDAKQNELISEVLKKVKNLTDEPDIAT